MIAADSTVLLVLAAGQSRRFGDADKLAAPYRGRPLALSVVSALANVAFLARVAVVSDTAVDFAAHGYSVVTNPAPDAGLSGSLRLGVAAAKAARAAAVVVVLADMPHITARHISRLFAAANEGHAVVAFSHRDYLGPPAFFAAGCFGALISTAGDSGARALLRGGRHLVASQADLVDVDTPEDLDRLRMLP